MNSLKTHQQILIWASAASVLAWIVPILSLIALPLQYLNTHAHEFFHALIGLVTGGQVSRITVLSTGAGETNVLGGSFVLVASAGYIGTSILGGVLLYCSRSEKGARACLLGLAGMLVVSMALWVRGDLVGVISGFGWIALLGALSTRLSGDWLRFSAVFVGLQLCLQAIQSLIVLLHLSAYPGMTSDAGILAEVTGIPALLWAAAWVGIGLTAMFVGAKRAWNSV